MLNEYKVSIVIPCYNSEKYIRRTMDSVCNQTFKQYEIIAVDDGSTDSTLKILKEYSGGKENITVITKPNDYGATTVRRGMELARGEYICIVDNDDLVSPRFIELLYHSVRSADADMAVCGFQRENRDKNKVFSREMLKKKDVIDVGKDYGALLTINSSLWNKIVRREIYEKLLANGDDITWIDLLCLAYIYPYVHKIAFVDEVLYYYQVRDGSVISGIKPEFVQCVYDSLLVIKQEYGQVNSKMSEFLNAYAFTHLGVSLLYRLYLNKDVDFRQAYRRNQDYLNTHFKHWLKNRYTTMKYVVSQKRNAKLFVCRLMYRLHMIKPFLAVYGFVTNKLRLEIKW